MGNLDKDEEIYALHQALGKSERMIALQIERIDQLEHEAEEWKETRDELLGQVDVLSGMVRERDEALAEWCDWTKKQLDQLRAIREREAQLTQEIGKV